MLIIGQRLKELRLENNLTQQQVANIVKVSRVYNCYENSKRYSNKAFMYNQIIKCKAERI